MPDPFPFPQLWSQVRRKSWMWLFKRHQIEAATKWVRFHAKVNAVALISAQELEMAGTVGRSDLTHEEARVRLRLAANGDLHLTTECSCHAGSLCEHAAALMLLCEGEAGRQHIEKIARPGASTVGEKAPGGTASGADDAVQIDNEKPRPFLRLRRVTVARPQIKIGRSQLSHAQISIGVAELSVRYDGCAESFPLPGRSSGARWQGEDGRTRALTRNAKMERLLLTDLVRSRLMPVMQAIPDASAEEPLTALFTMSDRDQSLHWSEFLRDDVPVLRAEGWEVEVPEDFGFSIHEAEDDAWFTDVEDVTGSRDSFALDLGVNVQGERISLVPLLVDCIDRGLTTAELEANLDEQYLIALPGPGNPVLAVPARRLLVLLRFLDELLASRVARKGGKLQLDKLRAAQLASLEGLPIRVPAELAALKDRLQGFTEMSQVSLPVGLRASLRPYQHEGLSWLQFLREFGLHGVLADDMGLGKTLQTLSHLLLEKESGRMDRPCLILAPTSVLRNWAREAAKFVPDLRVLLLHGDERHSDFRRIGKYDLVITSYPLLVRDADILRTVEWHVVALDEAQHIKNPKSKMAQVCGTLKSRHRLCLTGTPIENHLGELWSLFQFLMPGILGDADSFRSYYRNPIEKDGDAERQKQLAARLQPLLLRRTKSAVAKDLPPKTEILHTIELGKAQTDLYETIRAAMDQRVKEAISAQGLDRSQIIVLDALLKLRQVCCHPQLLKMEAAQKMAESAKTAYLMEDLLPELIDEGHRVLIFSQFTRMLAIIEEQLKAARIAFVKLTGDTQDRETPIRRFQAGEVPVFLISLKAGGAGLNLTTADTVIHYDPWWNPAAEAQASDRAHRIGQTKPVFIHKLICQDTIEERIVEMQKTKAALIEGLLTGRADKLRLTQDDIQRLLEA
ncbi:SNF2-related protein [Prosthecobacter dejongeii]|uniref:Superfamily II DNA or RNA helicase n=1 Tax=Prosthecobacter dejongeii TaxID=48465 RepID=A0A7W8DS99_9BACT|nr:superfamily II DNA or RNA helicase [Prosthecobacter dejongeii]